MTTYIFDPVHCEYHENQCMECHTDMSNSNNSLCLNCEITLTLREVISAPQHFCQECMHPIKDYGLCAGCKEEYDRESEIKHEYPDKDAEY